MRGLRAIGAGIAGALALAPAGAAVAPPSGPIVFASDWSPTLNVTHRWETSVSTHGTTELPRPSGTPSPDGRGRAIVTSDPQGVVSVDVQAVPSGEVHRVATFAPTETTIPSVSTIVWSPNSRRLAIVVDVFCRSYGDRDCNVYDLWAVRADGTQLHEVSLHARGPSWSPDSRELAFFGMVHDSPFVSYARASGGPPTPLAPGDTPTWSTHGRAIAYAGRFGLQLLVVGRRGARVLLRRRLTEPAVWSPDGKRIAAVTTSLQRSAQALHVVDAAGGHVRTLVAPTEGRVPTLPRWSPDGRRVAFTAIARNTPVRNVFAEEVNGGHATQVTDLDPWFTFTSLDWTRDGRALVWEAFQYHNDLELFSMRPDGSNLQQLTDNTEDDNAPSWSPGGRSIVVERANAIDSSPPGLFRLDLATGTETRLTTGNDHHPAWSPDGTAIAFSRYEGDPGDEHIFVTDPAGKSVTPLTPPEQSSADFPSWSPDGKRLVYVDQAPGSGFALYVINRDGSGLAQLTKLPFATAPAWSPDGTRIAFYGNEDLGPSYIYVMNADGTGLRRIAKPTTFFFPRPAWSPDGTRLLYEAQPDYAHSEIRSVDLDGTGDHVVTSVRGSAHLPAWTGVGG